MRSRFLTCCLVAMAVLSERSASAGGAEEDARKLFEQGIAAEQAGQLADSCAKFRQSLALVREVGPLSKVKDCDVREGKLVLGEATLRELIARWPQPGPELDALNKDLAALQKRIPQLTIRLRKGAPADISVRLDGRPVDFPAESRAVDPGAHEIIVDVPGQPAERVRFDLTDGEQKTVELPSGAAVDPKPLPPPPRESEGLGALGIAGIVVGIVGVGGFIGAGVTGGLVLDKRDAFEAGHCGPDDNLPGAAACDAIASDGDTLLVANGVLWGVGIAGVAVGATLLIVDLATDSTPEATQAQIGVRPGYAELRITF
jgi:hypothetical protein